MEQDNITIHQGSILDSKADVIVNPANGHLRHGGGLAKIIYNAALGVGVEHGPTWEHGFGEKIRQWDADHAKAPLIATGNAHLTSAGLLPFKGVIHAVGPIWNGGDFMEQDLLEEAHNSALQIAGKQGFKSIAFPAISCGIFGYPVEQAAPVAVTVAKWYPSLAVEFWLFEDAHVAAYQDALKAGLS